MKTQLIALLMGVALLAGCATEVAVGPPPEPFVYYGWYGGYYGPYYWDGPVIVFGAPHGWHGHYYEGWHERGNMGPPPHSAPHNAPHGRPQHHP